MDKQGLVFLDLDKTLLELKNHSLDSWREELSRLMHDKYSIETKLTPILTEVNRIRECNETAAKEILQCLDNHEMKSDIVPYEYTEKLLEKFSPSYKILITNNGWPVVHKVLETMSWEKCFDAVVTRTDCKNYKPHPEPFYIGMDKLNKNIADFNYFTMVGDNWKDLASAATFAMEVKCSFEFYFVDQLRSQL